jgi:hypothetical protein
MPTDLISRRLRSLLTDWLVANSTLRAIDNEFEGEQIELKAGAEQPNTGQRRSRVNGYYNSLDFTNPRDVRRFLNVLSIFIRQMELAHSTAGQELNFKKFTDQLAREGYAYNDGAISVVTATARLKDTKLIASNFDWTHISEQIERIESALDKDPALAIGTAKELTESCFKTILKERNVAHGNDDLPQLGRKTFKSLKLVPDDIPDSAKGADIIRRMLSNLSTVVQGLAELRGLYGTGHGKEGRVRGLTTRHARLCVGAAITLVTFVFQTHLETKTTD